MPWLWAFPGFGCVKLKVCKEAKNVLITSICFHFFASSKQQPTRAPSFFYPTKQHTPWFKKKISFVSQKAWAVFILGLWGWIKCSAGVLWLPILIFYSFIFDFPLISEADRSIKEQRLLFDLYFWVSCGRMFWWA